jgi:hypothetical protein
MGDDALQLDYTQTTEEIRALRDVRFRLLAFVPTVAAGAVGLLSQRPKAGELVAVGLVGLAATVGIVVYESRNAALTTYAVRRARMLEARLGIGLFTDRPAGRPRGLGAVYGAAVGGWSYVVAWGALHAWHVQHAQQLGGAVGAAAAVVVAWRIEAARPGSTERTGASPVPTAQ